MRVPTVGIIKWYRLGKKNINIILERCKVGTQKPYLYSLVKLWSVGVFEYHTHYTTQQLDNGHTF